MAEKILVTGVNGFVGGHLTEALRAEGVKVVGAGREEGPSETVAQAIDDYIQCDITNPENLDQLPLSEVDGVIHLAGLAAVGPSFDNPVMYMEVNKEGVAKLFEAADRQEAQPKFIIVSSGAIYDKDVEYRDENTPVDPSSSPYAESKIEAEAVVQHFRSQGHDAIIARPFNHTGPNQAEGFIVPDFAKQVVAAIEDPDYVIKVGNIATERDYTDVRDIVQAYIKLMMTDDLRHSVYNICSGKSASGEEILKKLMEAAGNPDLPFEAEVAKLRPTDVPKVVGSYDRLRDDTGWEPAISFDQTIEDTLDYWRNKKD